MPKRKPTITIVNEVDYVDLRLLNTLASTLQELADRYKLKDGEAVCFTNFNRTRFRLVVNIAGVIHLAIPGRDFCKNHDEYIMVAGKYHNLVVRTATHKRLDALIALNQERQVRAAAKAKTVRAQKNEFSRRR